MKSIIQFIKEKASRVVDTFSDLTGYAAVRVPLQKAKRQREVTLDLTGYRQIDSFSCGGIAAVMAVKFMRPQMSFERIYAAVNPIPKTVAGHGRVTRAGHTGFAVIGRPSVIAEKSLIRWYLRRH
ncbi:MAG: hypothetical protein NTV08_15995 [Verrucomicrobia bacterium]|nr:hypothetical protein [Verrucomicrobiota bacterium]